MNKYFILSIVVFFHVAFAGSAQQRIVAECTVFYTISADDSTVEKSTAASLKASTQTLYIKGNNSRVDLVSPAFSQSVVYDKMDTSAFILREFGNNKFITKLSTEEWVLHNKKYDSLQLVFVNETKRIVGYECKKAVIKLTNDASYLLYYATAIVPSVKEFEYQFKDIPGFVLEYITVDEKGKKIKYTANKINLSPVQQAKFDLPAGRGYRLLK